MTFWFRPRIRHPFFPGLSPTPAAAARGRALALSGAYTELERAATQGATARRAVFVLLECNAPSFTMAQRDRLWELFQTPIYAILIDCDGRVAGFECEAQNGFHAPGKRTAAGEALCECGRPGKLPSLEAHARLCASQARLAFTIENDPAAGVLSTRP